MLLAEKLNQETINIERKVIARGYDRKTCWAHARCGFVNDESDHGRDTVIVTLQKSFMSLQDHVHDVFSGLSMMRSDDGGSTWSPPVEQSALSRWSEPDGVVGTICDFTSQWHLAKGKLLGIGVTSRYRDGQIASDCQRRETAYAVFDPEKNVWGPARCLHLPDPEKFGFSGAGCVQWEELPGGDILLPIYFSISESGDLAARFAVVVLRCAFDGEELTVREVGGILALPVMRGLVEPSLAQCNGRFWLTLRNDERGYVTVSHDGLHFETPIPWTFCDGRDLGSYNTQQHWVRLGDRLFLVYTRSGLDNDHVVRHRAPLLIAEVDQERRVVLRDTEQILIPNRGAQLGNFGAVQKNDTEAWVCASEWMENAGQWNHEVWSALEKKFPAENLLALAATPGRCGLCELSGSDNSIHLVRLSLP